MMADPDRAGPSATDAMMKMVKFDIAALKAAYAGTEKRRPDTCRVVGRAAVEGESWGMPAVGAIPGLDVLIDWNETPVMAQRKACLFCELGRERILHQSALAVVFADSFPVSIGHCLVVPRRHVASLFGTTEDEQREMLRLLSEARASIQKAHAPGRFQHRHQRRAGRGTVNSPFAHPSDPALYGRRRRTARRRPVGAPRARRLLVCAQISADSRRVSSALLAA